MVAYARYSLGRVAPVASPTRFELPGNPRTAVRRLCFSVFSHRASSLFLSKRHCAYACGSESGFSIALSVRLLIRLQSHQTGFAAGPGSGAAEAVAGDSWAAADAGALPAPNLAASPPNKSIGSGNTTVVFFSVPISTNVWRYRSVTATGSRFKTAAASASRSDNLGSALPLGFGLRGDGPLHLLRQVHLFHVNPSHLNAPRLGMLVENYLELSV